MKHFILAGFFLLLNFIPNSQAFALSGREIMDLANTRESGDRSTTEMEMILIDKNGKKRVKKIRSFGIHQRKDKLGLMFFVSPADVKNTGFLTYDYYGSGKNDDLWLYLPALHKTKRTTPGDKTGSFMGSEFNYSDMSTPNLDEYEYTLMKETKVRDNPIWQVKAVPKTKEEIEESGYTKSVLFIRKDNNVVVRSVRWVHKKKRNKYMDVKKLKLIDGIWIATEMHMKTKVGKITLQITIIMLKNVRFNQNSVNTELFSICRLEKGL